MSFKNIIIFLCLVGTPLSLTNFGLDEKIQVIVKSFFWSLIFFALIYRVTSKEFKLYLTVKNPYYVLLVYIILNSILLNIAYGVLTSIVLFVFAVYIDQFKDNSRIKSNLRIMNSFLYSFLLLTAINYAFAILELGYLYNEGYQRLAGIVGQPSQSSQIASVTLLLLIFSRFHLSIKIILSLMTLYVIYKSGGRTIILSLIISLLSWKFLSLKMLKLSIFLTIILGVLFPFITTYYIDEFQALFIELSGFSRSGEESEVITLSGRVPLWRALIESLSDQWLVGSGYSSSKEILPTLYETSWGWKTDSAHNAYLHIFLETGIVGLLAILYLYFSLIFHLKNKELISLLFLLAIISVMSSTFAGPGISVLMFLLAFISNYAMKAK
jgi:O-antigen ligase